MMKKLLTYILVAAVALAKAAAQTQVVTADPVAYFRATYDFQSGDRIYKLELDLNNDGRKDILLSKTVHAEDGFDDVNDVPWEIFLLHADGHYASAGQKTDTGANYGVVASFRKDRYKIGFIPEINKYGLLHLECDRGRQAKCQLKAIVITGETWKEIPIGMPVDAEKNYQQLAERFANPPSPPVQELNP